MSTKIFLILVTLMAIIYSFSQLKNSKENWVGILPQRARPVLSLQSKKDGVVYASPLSASSLGSIRYRDAPRKGEFFTVPGTFQSQLSPRFGNYGGLGPNLNYRQPSTKHMAYDSRDPLSMSNMVSEQYCGPCKNGNSNAGNNNAGNNNAGNNNSGQNYVNELPVRSLAMASPADNAEVASQQYVPYERYITTNKKSRLFGHADYVRGDLPIVPCNSKWFNVSVNPQTDLNPGAMAAMGGINNDSANATWSLINAASGGTNTTMAGINMGVDKQSSLSAYGNDLVTTAFP